MKSTPSRISLPPSDPLKSATSSKLKSEVWGQADGNDSLSIVSLGKWAKMSFLFFLILMSIEFLLRPSIILISCVSSLLISGNLYYSTCYSCKKQQYIFFCEDSKSPTGIWHLGLECQLLIWDYVANCFHFYCHFNIKYGVWHTVGICLLPYPTECGISTTWLDHYLS